MTSGGGERRARALALLSLALVLTTGRASAAASGTATTATTVEAGHIRLASQTPWVTAGQYELDLRLIVTTAEVPSDVEVAVTVYPRSLTRSDFARTLEDKVRGSPLRTVSATLDQLTPDAGGAIVVRIPVRDPSGPFDPARLNLRTEGVYPVQVELREAGGGPTRDRFTTHLVYAPSPADAAPVTKLGFAWVLPVHGPVTLEPDGTRTVPAASLEAMQDATRALDARPSIPVVVEPGPEAVEALAASSREGDRAAVAKLAHVMAGRQVVPQSYVPLNLQAAADAGLEDEIAAQFDRGRRALATTMGLRPDPRTVVTEDRLDDNALARLTDRGVDRLLVPEADLAPIGLRVTLAQPFQLQHNPLGSSARPTAAVADPGLAAHFGTGDPVLTAHQLLADLAAIYFDNPARPRAVNVITPRSWRPQRAFLDTVLDGLATSPIVTAMSLDTLFDTIPLAPSGHDTPMVRSLASGPNLASALPAGAIRAARRRLDAFAPILDPNAPVLDSIEELLLVAETVDLRTRQRSSYLAGVEDQIHRQLRLIKMPANHTITLTARTGEIPVTIQNGSDHAIHVVVRVESDKLDFPAGATQRLDLGPKRSATQPFRVRARSTGAFPLRVSLTSPTGQPLLGPSRLTVRSTAASGVGIFLSAAAGVVLVSWWGRRLVRSWRARNRRLVPA